MGFWGTGPFHNDVAEEWFEQLLDQGPSLVESTLLDVEYYEGDACCSAVAAAEVVSGAGGHKCRGFPRELSDWLRESNFRPTVAQARQAKQIVKTIKSDSELAELFERDRGWLRRLDGLIGRLEKFKRPPPPKEVRHMRTKQAVARNDGPVVGSLGPNQIKRLVKELGGAVAIHKRQVFDVTLDDTKATDDDLKFLHVFPKLESVSLAKTRVTDAGLAHLASLKKLKLLNLRGTKVTGKGLAHLTLLPMTNLDLDSTRVTDDALKHVGAMKKLDWLQLCGTKVTDKGISHLSSLRKLEFIGLRRTNVTLASKEVLRKLGCDVVADFDL